MKLFTFRRSVFASIMAQVPGPKRWLWEWLRLKLFFVSILTAWPRDFRYFITIKFTRFTIYSLSFSKLDFTLGGEARLHYDFFREFVAKKVRKTFFISLMERLFLMQLATFLSEIRIHCLIFWKYYLYSMV